MTRTGAIYTPMLQLVIYIAMGVLMFLVLYMRGDASAGDMIAYITLAGLAAQADPSVVRSQLDHPEGCRRC